MNKRGRMIGEFVLIVVGVLVALMVEAGLEDRKDDQLREEYLSRIQADIESDKLALERRVGFFVSGLGSVARLSRNHPGHYSNSGTGPDAR